MQIYSAKIRLGGLLHQEVRKEELTASEILVLRGIHGADAVVDVTPILEPGTDTPYDVKRSSKAERARLLALYRDDQIKKVFPTDFAALPQTLVEIDEVELDEEDELEGVEAVDEAIKPKPVYKGLEAIKAKKAAAAKAVEEAGALA